MATADKEKIRYFFVFRRVLKYMHAKNRLLIPMIILATAGAVVSSYFPVLFQKTLIGTLLAETSDFTRLLIQVAVYFAVMLLASSAQALANGYCHSRFSLVRLTFMGDLLRKMLQTDYPNVEDPGFGARMQSVMASITANQTGFELLMHMSFKLPAVLISIFLLALLIGMRSPFILLAVGVNVGVMFWVKNSAKKLRFAKREEEMTAVRKVDYYSSKTSDFTFGKDIRIFGLARMLREGFRREMEALGQLYRLYQNYEFRLGLLAVITMTLCDVFIFARLYIQALNGLPIADFSMLLTAATSLSLLLKTAADDLVLLTAETRYVQKSYEFLDEEERKETGRIAVPPKETLEIEFRDVSFRYPGSDRQIFDKLNFRIRAGEKLAVVGVNGAGKTTLVKLLTGLFRPTSGEILINGIPQSEFRQKTLYRMFACVFQDFFILPFDVRTNVAVTEERLRERKDGEAEVWRVLEQAGLRAKIESLPQKLDQKLNKSVYDDAIDLSGGEAQKLTIARALFKDGNMIILDEPTAALDALAEQEIYREFSELTQHKTTLFISHRLASTQFCDRIILLDGEGIGEVGTHQELMALKGKYYEMFKTQGKYYQQEAAHEEI